MTDPPAVGPHAPPVRVLLLAGVVILLAVWFLLQLYSSAAVRECRALYRAAHTAADTAGVDSTVTPGSRAQADPRSCGFLRRAARWQ